MLKLLERRIVETRGEPCPLALLRGSIFETVLITVFRYIKYMLLKYRTQYIMNRLVKISPK